MKIALVVVAVASLVSGCSKHARFQKQLDQIEAGLTMELEVGELAQISGDRTVRDFHFEIQNGSSQSTFLSYTPPQVLSDYLRERNPHGIGYRVQTKNGTKSWRLTNFGLSSSSTEFYELKPGGSLSFRVPVPTTEKFAEATHLRLMLILFASIDDSNGRIVYSPLTETTKANSKE